MQLSFSDSYIKGARDGSYDKAHRLGLDTSRDAPISCDMYAYDLGYDAGWRVTQPLPDHLLNEGREAWELRTQEEANETYYTLCIGMVAVDRDGEIIDRWDELIMDRGTAGDRHALADALDHAVASIEIELAQHPSMVLLPHVLADPDYTPLMPGDIAL